jgi:hypothetical protein
MDEHRPSPAFFYPRCAQGMLHVAVKSRDFVYACKIKNKKSIDICAA